MKLSSLITLACSSALLLITACTTSSDQESINTYEVTFDNTIITMPKGWDIEKLYSPARHAQGSWVSITEGPDNTMFSCDQYGKIYNWKIPLVGDTLTVEDVDTIDLDIGYAHGLLWAFNSLYVVVVKDAFDPGQPDRLSSGVYRLTDSDKDGRLDTKTPLLRLDGTGEHGPHTLRVGPDGKSLYLLAGNFNSVPDHFESKLPRNWGEDNLLPPYLDASGHAVDLKAPGGWFAKTDPDGTKWTLIAAGMRNPFGFGFNADGEAFAYDADMEWDFGMPWYRPTRILHLTSGAEFGWRTGSGKWPTYYPDNLPSVIDMAQGSPTAVVMGKGLNFPSRYRNGLFACDWSFGTMYFVDLIPDKSSYRGTKEEFLSGVPLPITNATAGSDGHLYFTTGGRRMDGAVYRVRYVGDESTEVLASSGDHGDRRNHRRSIEEMHQVHSSAYIDRYWPHLDAADPRLSYAARIALEHQPISFWRSKLTSASDSNTIIAALLAYARSDGAINDDIIKALSTLEYSNLSSEQKIGVLRAISILLIRHDNNASYHEAIRSLIKPHFPVDDMRINLMISQILIYLDDTDVVRHTLALLDQLEDQTIHTQDILSKELLSRSEQYGPQIADMIDNLPPTDAISFITALSHATAGWSKELRTRYFQWFYKALNAKGGVSYKAFLDNIRSEALSNVPEEKRDVYADLAGFYSPLSEMSNLPQPVGPGKNYNLMDLGRIAVWGNKIDNYKGRYIDGERAYKAALCYSCHQMNGDGGASGPDLTNLATRMGPMEIASAILSPNEEISNQYHFTNFHMKDGSQITGRIVKDQESFYTIFQSPYDITATKEIAKSDIQETSTSPISPMPAKLLDRLNEQEVLDLMVYLMAEGDDESELFD